MAYDDNLTRFLPLYAQVKQHLIQRIVDQIWVPGSLLPSESNLAVELGVSQGTVRKALDEMAAEKLVVRRQGRGTFVAEHTQEQALFHFFRLVDTDDKPIPPASEVLSIRNASPNRLEMKRLDLSVNDKVTRVVRLRFLNAKPSIIETLSVPANLVPGLADQKPLPNSLYSLYQKVYGISVLRAVDRLTVCSADEKEAELLGIEPGQALLEIERTAVSIDGRKIELRVSRLVTDQCSYRVELT